MITRASTADEGTSIRLVKQQRCDGPLNSAWHPASGALEEGEGPEEAALRELQEELTLDATGRFWRVRYEYGYPAADEPPERQAEWPPGTEWITVTGFIAEAPAGFEPTLNFEHDDYRWCSRKEAIALFRWPDVGVALESLWRQRR